MNSAFTADVLSFVSNSEFFTKLEILHLLANAFYFIFVSSMSLRVYCNQK